MDCDTTDVTYGCFGGQVCDSEGHCVDENVATFSPTVFVPATGTPTRSPIAITNIPTESPVTSFPTVSPSLPLNTPVPTATDGGLDLPEGVEIIYVLAGMVFGAVTAVLAVCGFSKLNTRKAEKQGRDNASEASEVVVASDL